MDREPTEMERRVATALSVLAAMDYHGKDFCDEIRKEAEGHWSGYVSEARTAIRAMREPTDEMVHQVRMRLEHQLMDPGVKGWLIRPWQELIDAASPDDGK